MATFKMAPLEWQSVAAAPVCDTMDIKFTVVFGNSVGTAAGTAAVPLFTPGISC